MSVIDIPIVAGITEGGFSLNMKQIRRLQTFLLRNIKAYWERPQDQRTEATSTSMNSRCVTIQMLLMLVDLHVEVDTYRIYRRAVAGAGGDKEYIDGRS